MPPGEKAARATEHCHVPSRLYKQFADRALLDGYTALWRVLVVPNLTILQPLVTLFEFALGPALLSRGRAVLTGHAFGAVVQAGLVLAGPWGTVNVALVVLHLSALRRSSPRTAIGLTRRHLGSVIVDLSYRPRSTAHRVKILVSTLLAVADLRSLGRHRSFRKRGRGHAAWLFSASDYRPTGVFESRPLAARTTTTSTNAGS